MLFGRKKTTDSPSTPPSEDTASRPKEEPFCKRILVVMDSTARARDAGSYAIQLAAALHCELLAVYVVDIPSMDYLVRLNYFSAAERESQELEMTFRGQSVLTQLEEEAALHGVSVRSFCLRGSRYRQILETAEREDVGLIVLKESKDAALRKDHTAVDRQLLLNHAQCPVLICSSR
jgi:nucleotide-binding universal stress UspA family protein